MRSAPAYALAGALAFAGAGLGAYAVAQNAAEQQLDAAVAELREALGPQGSVTWRERRVEPVTGRAEFLGLVVSKEDRKAEAESLALTGLRPDGVAEAVARGVRFTESDGIAEIESVSVAGLTVPPRSLIAQGPSAFFAQFRLDRAEIVGLSVDADQDVVIARAVVEQVGGGRPGKLTITGLAVDAEGADRVDEVEIAGLTLTGIDLAATFAALAEDREPPRPRGSVTFEATEVVLGHEGNPVGRMDAFRIASSEPRPGVTAASFAITGLRAEAVQELAEQLRAYGYDALTADLAIEGSWDETARRLEVGTLRLGARDVGTLGIAFALGGLPEDPSKAGIGDLMGATVESLSLSWADESLYGRVLRVQAQQGGTTAEQLRTQVGMMAGMFLVSPGPASPALDAVREAVMRFIGQTATTLELTAKPAQPVPVAMVPQLAGQGGPAQVVSAFGITAAAR